MSSPQLVIQQVEPKYCEQCGMHFVRPAGSADRYCKRHRDFQEVAEHNALLCMTTERVRSRVLSALQWALHNGEFGSARATALADALIIVESRR